MSRIEVDAAIRKIAALTEEEVRDYEQGVCFFCGAGWEQVPGPRGGKGKYVNTHRHEPDCPYVVIRDALNWFNMRWGGG